MAVENKAVELLGVLDLERIEDTVWRGQNENRPGRLFGGQVLAQALIAATNTVPDDRLCHSLHGYFLRPGRNELPVIYTVDQIRDGRSFTTRRIVAIQDGEAIFSMDLSFHVHEPGLLHQIDMSRLPGPQDLLDDRELLSDDDDEETRWSRRERPFEVRSVYQESGASEGETSYPVWIKFHQPITGSQALHQGLLAYASDMGLVSTSLLPHRSAVNRQKMQVASLDHALWFHHDLNVNNWLVYIKETTRASSGRGFNRGAFYDESGKLVASSMQEGLIRQLT